jgi:hypothetical protein
LLRDTQPVAALVSAATLPKLSAALAASRVTSAVLDVLDNAAWRAAAGVPCHTSLATPAPHTPPQVPLCACAPPERLLSASCAPSAGVHHTAAWRLAARRAARPRDHHHDLGHLGQAKVHPVPLRRLRHRGERADPALTPHPVHRAPPPLVAPVLPPQVHAREAALEAMGLG